MSAAAALLGAIGLLLASAPTRSFRGALAAEFSATKLWLLGPTLAVVLVWVFDGHTLVLALIALAVAAGVTRLIQKAAQQAQAASFAEHVIEACDSMAADLAAGQPPQAALDRVADRWGDFAAVAMAGHMGADVPDAMRKLATRQGGGALRRIAATWQVASRTGAGLAQALETAAANIRAQRRIQRLVETELSGARATARLLAALPIGVLAMGQGIGGRPFHFLLSSTLGLGCLAVGATLSLVGLFWIDRIASKVQQS